MMENKHPDTASQILLDQVNELKKGTRRRKLSPEAVHDMRVATRRLRAALKTFKKVYPPSAQEMRNELKQTARLLGKKRDLDVFLEFLIKSLDAKVGNFPQLAKQALKNQKEILAILKTVRFATLLKNLERLQPEESYKLCKFAKKHIRKAFKRVLKLKNDDELHPLRIGLKKLRYNCEFFSSLFALESCIEKTKEIQDLLGDHQDAITGIALLKNYRDQFSSMQFKIAKGALKQQEKERRRAFAKIWKSYSKLAEKTVARL